MQLDKLYPTVSTGNIDITAGITSITDDRIKTDFFDPYFMGYLTPQNAPINIRPIKYTLGDSLVISPVDDNIAWGYLVGGNEASYAKTIYRTDRSAITQYNSGGGDRYLINAVEMARVCLSGTIDIVLYTRFIMDDYYADGVGVTELVRGGQGAGNIQEVHVVFNINDFLSMYKNGGTFLNTTVRDTSAVSPVYNIDFPLNINFNDMPKDGSRTLYIPFSEHGCVIAVQIIGYSISSNTTITNNGATREANIKPFSAYSFDNNKISIIPGRYERNIIRFEFNTSTLQFANLSSYSDSTISSTPIDDIDGYLMGAFDVQFTADVFAVADMYHNMIFGNTYYCDSVSKSTTMVFRLTNVFGIDDLYKYLLLCHKNTTAPSDTYSTNDTVTVFTNDDTLTMDTVSGTLSDIISRLRPWQIPNVDITANTFTPEDIPDPDPDPGAEDEGDSITRPSAISVGGTNGFVTQYVLTSAQISALGRGLWAGVADRAFWDNWLWTALLEAGTFNVSDILQFFISLRVYPFSLINVSSYQGTGSAALWLGRGTKAIDLGTQDNLGTISQYADILDAGSLTVPAYYGDFRDYDHVSIILHAPYIGTISLAAGDVVGAALHLVYAIDFASGSCTAYLDISRGGIQYPICIGSGVIGADVPLTADSAARRVAAAIDLGFDTVAGISAVFSGDPLSAAGAAANMAKQQPTVPTLSATGKGFDSFAGAQTAYIQIRRGKYAEGKTPGAAFKSTYGEQLDQPAMIGSFTGFTKFVNVDTAGLRCDAAERSAILTQLQSGVYI